MHLIAGRPLGQQMKIFKFYTSTLNIYEGFFSTDLTLLINIKLLLLSSRLDLDSEFLIDILKFWIKWRPYLFEELLLGIFYQKFALVS